MGPLESPYLLRAFDEAQHLHAAVMELHDDPRLDEDVELKLEYLHTLHAFFEKEHMIYIRLSPHRDTVPEVKEVLENMESHLDYHLGLEEFYRESRADIKMKIKALSGEDLDMPPDID